MFKDSVRTNLRRCQVSEDGAHSGNGGQVGLLMDEMEELIGAATEVVEVEVAIDSGCVGNAIHPKQLPLDAKPTPNTSGKHYTGAGGDTIEKYGNCDTLLDGEHGEVGCNWNLANVTRALHSVAVTTGEIEKPKNDVLFNAGKCVVVPPGIVDRILAYIKPIIQYNRNGNIYTAKMKMSSFTRPAIAA